MSCTHKNLITYHCAADAARVLCGLAGCLQLVQLRVVEVLYRLRLVGVLNPLSSEDADVGLVLRHGSTVGELTWRQLEGAGLGLANVVLGQKHILGSCRVES